MLAVFLSFWTWVYTYKKDGWKFWVGLTASILPVVVAMYMSVSMAGRLSSVETVAPAQKAEVLARIINDALGGFRIVMLACIGVGVVTWIWAIVDALAKKRDWYDSYQG